MSSTKTRRPKGGIGITRRGDKFEATYNIPKSQLPPGKDRDRITAWGDTEIAATAALIDKLRRENTVPDLPGAVPAAQERQLRAHLGPDGKDIKGTRNPRDPDYLGPLLSEWTEEWLTRWMDEHLQESSKNIYRGHIKTYILPYIGHYHMNELSANVLLDKWWRPIGALRKVKNGIVTDKPLLGASAKANVYKTLRILITTAHAKHRTRVALTEALIKKPVPKRPETDQEIRDAAGRLQGIFMDNPNKDDPRWSLWMPALLGIRISERLAIRVQDVDLDGEGGPTVMIHQQLDFLKSKGGWYIKDTTKNGEPRTIPLMGLFLEAMERHLALRAEWAARPDWKPEEKFKDLLFLQPGGQLWTRRQDTPAWEEFVGPGIRGHLARHITGHMLAHQGVPIETAMALLGHRSEAMSHYYRVASLIAMRRDLEAGQATANPPADVVNISRGRRRA